VSDEEGGAVLSNDACSALVAEHADPYVDGNIYPITISGTAASQKLRISVYTAFNAGGKAAYNAFEIVKACPDVKTVSLTLVLDQSDGHVRHYGNIRVSASEVTRLRELDPWSDNAAVVRAIVKRGEALP
jgi:hypothetical protein